MPAKYLGIDNTDPNKVAVFKIAFSKKGTKALSLSLDKAGYLHTFRFETESDEILKMMKRDK